MNNFTTSNLFPYKSHVRYTTGSNPLHIHTLRMMFQNILHWPSLIELTSLKYVPCVSELFPNGKSYSVRKDSPHIYEKSVSNDQCKYSKTLWDDCIKTLHYSYDLQWSSSLHPLSGVILRPFRCKGETFPGKLLCESSLLQCENIFLPFSVMHKAIRIKYNNLLPFHFYMMENCTKEYIVTFLSVDFSFIAVVNSIRSTIEIK